MPLHQRGAAKAKMVLGGCTKFGTVNRSFLVPVINAHMVHLLFIEDTFGQDDDDWMVYREIVRTFVSTSLRLEPGLFKEITNSLCSPYHASRVVKMTRKMKRRRIN